MPDQPTDQEISDKRDDAVEASKNPNHRSPAYAEGVRDALEWVLGDLEGDLEI